MSRPTVTLPSSLAAYAEAGVLALAALVVARVAEPVAHPGAFLMFAAAIGVVAWRRGWRAALLTALLATAAMVLVFAPPGSGRDVAIPDLLRLAMFVATARVVSSLRTSRQAARSREHDLTALAARLEEQARELERRVAQSQELAERLARSNRELGDVAGRAGRDRDAAEELARRRQEELAILDLMLATSPVGFAHWDDELRFVRVNARLAEMDGAPAAEHPGRTVREVAPRLAPVLDPLLRRALESGEPVIGVEVEGAPVVHGGKSRAWLASYYPLRSAEGRVQGVGGVFVDITERKQIEAQLRHAQKMEAVGRLAGGIAHDFNNILTAIKSYSQFLAEGIAPDDALAQDVHEIATAADRAAALTRQLLAFSRRQVLQPRVVDVGGIVLEVERTLARIIGEDIELVTRLEPEPGLVRADPGQLEQVLLNLVVNARDAMPDGGVLMIETANVSVMEGSDEAASGLPVGEHVRLTVRDTGEGMSADAMSHAFEPFFTTKAHRRRSGLGLATVYGIVKQSGGEVRITSTPGRGTAVEIFLARLPGASATAARREPVFTVSVTETVLLVEDDETLRPLMRRVLEAQGYRVLDARHGGEAVHVAARHDGPLHLLITDVVMPEMGGRELAQRLSAARPGTRVLYISGYTDDAVIRQGMLEPGSAFLQKPFTPTDLLVKAREVLAASA